LQLRLIGAGDRIRDAVPYAEVAEWSEAEETSMLSECDIGLMPLPDDEFTRGKCGLKLIQYMAAGLPVVGSPVGANCEIISESEDGFLAGQPHEWAAALERLIISPELRRQFGCRGAAKVRSTYSLERGFESWINLIESRVQHGSGNV
jgi:glycosyltransferase involved in cell wall biosynthesis